jgi:hypothetical protein
MVLIASTSSFLRLVGDQILSLRYREINRSITQKWKKARQILKKK